MVRAGTFVQGSGQIPLDDIHVAQAEPQASSVFHQQLKSTKNSSQVELQSGQGNGRDLREEASEHVAKFSDMFPAANILVKAAAPPHLSRKDVEARDEVQGVCVCVRV